jgi:hypothetical protein
MATKSSDLFVGPRPYEEKDARIFFARDREARDLLSLVIANPLLLIYAPSGAGKTSLINARLALMLGHVKDPELIPLLGEGKGFDVLPTARVSGLVPEGIDLDAVPGANIFVFNTLMSWRIKDSAPRSPGVVWLDEKRLAEKRLADYLEEMRPAVTPVSSDEGDEDDLPAPRVIIFDQFEELFTSHFERWEDREGFFEQVSDALAGGPVFLRRRDIRQPAMLVRRLAEAADPVSSDLRGHLSLTARRVLDSFDSSPRLLAMHLDLLVEELNSIIKGESLYDQSRFAGIKLRDETQRLIRLKPKSGNYSALNRLLLEDAYSREIYLRARGDRTLRVIFSMREDYIAELDPYIHLLPDRLATRYRLERLRRAAALAAVTSPMRYTNLRFAEGVAEQLVENLLKTPVRTAGDRKQEAASDILQLQPDEGLNNER